MNTKNETKISKTKRKEFILKNSILIRRSLIYQTKEFFKNSTLHGVRYIAESGRPIGEKFMWFCFTVTGAVTALVIIMSLWEKFQTNPTITGLDTDFYNQQVIFPTTVICPIEAYDNEKVYKVGYKTITQYDEDTTELVTPFLQMLTKLSFDNIEKVYSISLNFTQQAPLDKKNLRYLVFQVQKSCEEILLECKYRGDSINCCTHFEPVYTEHGFCYAFNSRFISNATSDEKSANVHNLYETDKKWSLSFVPNVTSKLFIFSQEEYFGADLNSEVEWAINEDLIILVSNRHTQTTEDTRQLSIKQRKCIFSDEMQLTYFKGKYEFSACMKECRLKKAIKLCKCVPPFYMPIRNFPTCNINQFPCLAHYKANITNIRDCLQCELSCQKTVYNIAKLTKNIGKADDQGVRVEFLTWPIIQYKREVLFGWVDLLVSFGGIAGLFLGFSLLSGVEIIYYFTLRACCMVYRNREELYALETDIMRKSIPKIDMKLIKKKEKKISLKKNKRKSSLSQNTKINTNKPTKRIGSGILIKSNKFGRNIVHSKESATKTMFREVVPAISLVQWNFQKSISEPSTNQLDYLP